MEQANPVEKLVNRLKELEDSEAVQYTASDGKKYIQVDVYGEEYGNMSRDRREALQTIFENVEWCACETLITKGRPNFENIELLEKVGYKVTKGEYDSFGWLTGCIRTSKGIYVYG